jgi:RimJ/RimL family protein N-acetyltransferase
LSLACAVDATLDGTCPGGVWVDDPIAPTAALVDTPEGHYVFGNAQHECFNHSLVTFILDTLSPGGRGADWWWFYLRCPTEAWAEAMRRVLPDARTVEKPREFYGCKEVVHELRRDLRGKVPPGFDLVRVDASFLARDDVANLDPLRRRARSNFGSLERFLACGFAFCIVYDNRVVSDCAADNVSSGCCEVGVHTAEGYRRRGLATLTVAAAVDWALSHGFNQVGWHCLRYNTASSATARKVGFRKVQDYTAFMICAKPADADVLKGNLCLLRQEFTQAAAWYEKALHAVTTVGEPASNLLGRREDQVRYAFQAACARALAGQREAGVAMLAAAIEAAGYRQGGY